VPQAIAATHLAREGQETRAGQVVSYVITNNESRITGNRALPAEFLDEPTCYDSEWYANLILSSTVNLLLPFGYNVKSLRDWSRSS
jgi:DNA polymerase elongation subunit (family B)